MAGKTNGAASLMQGNNKQVRKQSHRYIAKACHVIELCFYYDVISFNSGDLLYFSTKWPGKLGSMITKLVSEASRSKFKELCRAR